VDWNNGDVTVTHSAGTLGLLTFAGAGDGYSFDSAIRLPAPATKTGTSYTVVSTDSSLIFNASGTFTLTLPTASSFTGRIMVLKSIVNQTLVSASANVGPINSATAGTAILPAVAGQYCMLQSDGTNWITMDNAGIIGPSSSVDGDLLMFSGTTGSLVADGGFKATHVGAELHRICGGM